VGQRPTDHVVHDRGLHHEHGNKIAVQIHDYEQVEKQSAKIHDRELHHEHSNKIAMQIHDYEQVEKAVHEKKNNTGNSNATCIDDNFTS